MFPVVPGHKEIPLLRSEENGMLRITSCYQCGLGRTVWRFWRRSCDSLCSRIVCRSCSPDVGQPRFDSVIRFGCIGDPLGSVLVCCIFHFTCRQIETPLLLKTSPLMKCKSRSFLMKCNGSPFMPERPVFASS